MFFFLLFNSLRFPSRHLVFKPATDCCHKQVNISAHCVTCRVNAAYWPSNYLEMVNMKVKQTAGTRPSRIDVVCFLFCFFWNNWSLTFPDIFSKQRWGFRPKITRGLLLQFDVLMISTPLTFNFHSFSALSVWVFLQSLKKIPWDFLDFNQIWHITFVCGHKRIDLLLSQGGRKPFLLWSLGWLSDGLTRPGPCGQLPPSSVHSCAPSCCYWRPLCTGPLWISNWKSAAENKLIKEVVFIQFSRFANLFQNIFNWLLTNQFAHIAFIT